MSPCWKLSGERKTLISHGRCGETLYQKWRRSLFQHERSRQVAKESFGLRQLRRIARKKKDLIPQQKKGVPADWEKQNRNLHSFSMARFVNENHIIFNCKRNHWKKRQVEVSSPMKLLTSNIFHSVQLLCGGGKETHPALLSANHSRHFSHHCWNDHFDHYQN